MLGSKGLLGGGVAAPASTTAVVAKEEEEEEEEDNEEEPPSVRFSDMNFDGALIFWIFFSFFDCFSFAAAESRLQVATISCTRGIHPRRSSRRAQFFAH